MVKIKRVTPIFTEPGSGVEVILDNGRILFVDVYEFLDFLSKKDKPLFRWLFTQTQINSAAEEMKYVYELGVPFEETMGELMDKKESEFPGWLYENSYPILRGDEEDRW